MRSLSVFVVVLLAAVYGSNARDTRIAGGATASIYVHPHIVQLGRDNLGNGIFTQECAGTLITASHVLTAAHCFFGAFASPFRWQTRAGSPNRLTGGILRNVQMIINHPTFNPITHVGDVSIIIVNLPYVETTSLRRGTIAPQGSNLAANVVTTIAGWGAINLAGTRNNLLLQALVPVVNIFTCRNNYQQLGRFITDDMICAGLANVGICTGDNGGPLAVGNIVHGIASFYTGCGNALFPGVFTRVGAFTTWIVNIANTT